MTGFAIGFAVYVTLSALVQRTVSIEAREIPKDWNGITHGR